MTIHISGSRLPIILLSHGQGASNNLSSLNGYGPLVNFRASHGFAVIQPTHLLPKAVKIEEEGMVDGPQHWQSRVEDFKSILDQENEIEGAFQAAKGRLDWNRLLLGAQSKETTTRETINMIEPRIKAGVLIVAPGCDPGGLTQSPMAVKLAPFFADSSFSEMTTPALVVHGDADIPDHLTTKGL
ncbi:uncharacterized protein RSE6_11700 [Rhynchosporium secalis]|uniref:Phospholipase/carboxylesterase/thioesterase domain-containing protein n=1 Tax=Rhynchosporium secalis TaxID=38038 RepID=A0A1E1MPL0_RHYSE|nr:uncharacterized protein RSE6_11700 [Rhynchosporium secalis]